MPRYCGKSFCCGGPSSSRGAGEIAGDSNLRVSWVPGRPKSDLRIGNWKVLGRLALKLEVGALVLERDGKWEDSCCVYSCLGQDSRWGNLARPQAQRARIDLYQASSHISLLCLGRRMFEIRLGRGKFKT